MMYFESWFKHYSVILPQSLWLRGLEFSPEKYLQFSPEDLSLRQEMTAFP
jgi:hypothetical protein